MLKKIGIGFVALIVLAAIFGEDKGGNSGSNASVATTNPAKQNFIGQSVQGRYFKVGVKGVSETKNAPDDFVCGAAPSGSRYVMVNIAIENTDSESRSMMTEGEIHVRHDGKWIEYDQTETCTLGQDGFLNFMEDIGPFVVKEGKITFVIPDRFAVEDMVYLTPRDDEKIYLKQRPVENQTQQQ